MKTLALAALGTTLIMVAPGARAAEEIGTPNADTVIAFGSIPQAGDANANSAAALASQPRGAAAAGDTFTAAADSAQEQDPAQLAAWSIGVMAVPEPNSWAMMIAGFAVVGYVMRRRVTAIAFA